MPSPPITPEVPMRRLHLLGLFWLSVASCASPTDTTQAPSNTPADNPGNAGDNSDPQQLGIRVTDYDLHGCSGRSVDGCVTARVHLLSNGSGFILQSLSCDTDPYCGPGRVELFNLKAEYLWGAWMGDYPRDINNGVVVYGLARMLSFSDASFTDGVYDAIPLTITKVTFGR